MLRPRQIVFCEEYLASGNATQAAGRAGYGSKNARKIGSRNLTKPSIVEYLNRRTRDIAKKMHITPERVVLEYAKIAFFDIGRAYNESGALKPLHDMDSLTRGAIAGIETFEEKTQAGEETIVEGTIKKLKVWDKKAALDSICKVMGFNAPEKTESKNTSIIATSENITTEQFKELHDLINGNRNK